MCVRCCADFMLEGNRVNSGGFCEVTCGRCRCRMLLAHCCMVVQNTAGML